MSIKVWNEVEKADYNVGDPPAFIVKSHWHMNSHVVLIINGEEITVIANDLIKAIANATNANTY